jgi:hypothetical protein
MASPGITVNVGANTDDLNSDLDRATGRVRRFARTAANAVAGVAKATGVAALAAGVGLAAFARSQANVIDANTKLARSLGLTHNEFIAMAQVANEAGVETGQLSQILGVMQRNIIELGKGTKTQEDAFRRLGLSMADLEGQSPSAQFAIIAERLDQIEDPATRTATAMDVLGKSGRGAINMLGNYTEKVAQATAFQEKFGLTVNQFDAESIETANDALGRVFEAMKGLGRIVASYVAPLVTYLANAFLASSVSADSFRAFGVRAMSLVGAGIDLIRIGITRMQLGFQLAKAGILTFASSGIKALKPLAEAMDYVNNRFGGSMELTAKVMAQAAAFDVSAEAATKAANAYRDQLTSFETTADAIARVREEVLAAQSGSDLETPTDGEVTVPGAGDGAAAGSALGAIGSAASVTEGMESRLEALRAGWVTEDEATAAWYAQGQQTLADALAAEKITVAQHKSDLQSLEQEHASRVMAIEERKNQQTKQSQNAAMASVKTGLMALFGESKAVRVAMAIADTFAGATRALAEHPAPYSYIVAAGIVAAGLANVKSILSAKPGGGGGASASGGAAAGAAAAAKEPDRTQTFSFNIQNDSMGFGESFARQMVEQLNNAQRNGGTIRGVIA